MIAVAITVRGGGGAGGGGRREEFASDVSIGRAESNDLVLRRGNVSKRHARLAFKEGQWIVTDLNSTNGTYVNRRRIDGATPLQPGDRVYIGDFVLVIDACHSS